MTGVTLPNESRKINKKYTSLLPRSADDHAGVPGHNSNRAPNYLHCLLTGAGCARALRPVVSQIDELNMELSREKAFAPVAQSLNITAIADRGLPSSEAVFCFAIG